VGSVGPHHTVGHAGDARRVEAQRRPHVALRLEADSGELVGVVEQVGDDHEVQMG